MIEGKRTYCGGKVPDGLPIRNIVEYQGAVDVWNDLTVYLLGPLDLLDGSSHVFYVEILEVELDQGDKVGNTLDVGANGGYIGCRGPGLSEGSLYKRRLSDAEGADDSEIDGIHVLGDQGLGGPGGVSHLHTNGGCAAVELQGRRAAELRS